MIELYSLLSAIGIVFVAVGLIGAVVPVLPGPVFIWLGVFLWAWADGFVRIGWPTLVILAVLTIVAWGADIGLSALSSRRAGAGWRSLLFAIGGGLAGGAIGTPIPIIGNLVGAVVGSIAALWYGEYRAKGTREAATRAVRSYVSGYVAAMVIELAVAVLMIGIFVWQALA